VPRESLTRGDESVRKRQAIGLRNWASEQRLPIIAIGDYNFDVDFKTRQGNEAYKRFTEGGVCEWVKPEELIDSNWADVNPRLAADQRTVP
jgi:hypothetical protein